MKTSLAFVLCAVLALGAALPSAAGEVNFNGTLVGAFPVGGFADKDGIVKQAPYGWSALGGAAGTGLGFNLEIETRIGKVTWLGFRFGYVKYGGDASEVMDYINSRPDTSGVEDEITALDATWTHTFMSFPVRFVARDFKSGSTYLRFDIGWVRVTNCYEGTYSVEAPPAEEAIEFDARFGNQFFLAGGVGADFRVGKSLAVIAELRYNYIFSSGVEGLTTVAGQSYKIHGRFDAQTVEAVVGLRIPLSGI
jgi:hypothetical protein